MKKTTERIFKYFPKAKEKLLLALKNETVNVSDLSQMEYTFYSLALFFEKPESYSFDLGMFYASLENEWLEFALELVAIYFQKETSLIQKPSFSIIKEQDEFLNSSQFAELLCDHGLKYDRAKIKNYYDRGKLPDADIIIAGVKYWRKETAEAFCKEELLRNKILFGQPE